MKIIQAIKSSRYIWVLMVSMGAMLISFSGVYVKFANIGPTTSAFYRTFIGAILLFFIAIYRKDRFWNSGLYFLLAVLCGFAFALDLFTWHKSILYVGPGLATILANFQVFCLALFGIVYLGEKMSLRLVLAIPLALIGLFLIIGLKDLKPGSDYIWGVLLGLITALCYTAYILTLRRLQTLPNPLSPYANLCITSLITAIFLAGLVVHQNEQFVIPDGRSMGATVAYGIFSQVLGWVFITKGLPNIRASIAGLLLLLQPALAFVWDILFFSRPFTMLSLGGVLMTLAAIYLGTTSGRKTVKK